MQTYHDTVQDSAGNGVTTASIYIYTSGGGLAAIKEDDGATALSNPITSADADNYDSKGNFSFKAANGIYDIKVVASDTTWKYKRVLFDFNDNVDFAGNISLADLKEIQLGNLSGGDLELVHDGVNSLIRNYTGEFTVQQRVNSGLLTLKSFNSSGTIKTGITVGGAVPKVELNYDGTEAVHTVAGGYETGALSSSGSSNGTRVVSEATKSSTTSTGSIVHRRFYNPNGSIGTIVTNGTATAYNTASDKRLKESEGLLDKPFNIINALEVHKFHFLTDPDNSVHGLMAQDAYEVYPQAVTKPEDENDRWGIDQGKFTPLLLAGAQEHDKKIDDLKKELKALKGKIKQLEAI